METGRFRLKFPTIRMIFGQRLSGFKAEILASPLGRGGWPIVFFGCRFVFIKRLRTKWAVAALLRCWRSTRSEIRPTPAVPPVVHKPRLNTFLFHFQFIVYRGHKSFSLLSRMPQTYTFPRIEICDIGTLVL